MKRSVLTVMFPLFFTISALAAEDAPFIYPEGTAVQGGGAGSCIEGDCVNGKGVFVYDTGYKYSGEWKDGRKEGKGVFTYPDGRTAQGTFKADLYDGQIIMLMPNGSVYASEYREGKMQ